MSEPGLPVLLTLGVLHRIQAVSSKEKPAAINKHLTGENI